MLSSLLNAHRHIMQHSSHRSVSRERYQEQFSCFRYGNKANHKNSKCPAADKACKFCHYGTVCFKTLLSKNRSTRYHGESRKTQSIVISNISLHHTTQCPTLDLEVSCKNGGGHLTITPDSGLEMTAIGLHHLKQLGMNVTHLLPVHLLTCMQQTTQCWSLLADFMLSYATLTQ